MGMANRQDENFICHPVSLVESQLKFISLVSEEYIICAHLD
jgi:hypothetical protein